MVSGADRQRIDNLMGMAEDQLQILGQYAGMEVPRVSPERIIALWHVDDTFPEGMEMIALRVKLESALDAVEIQR